MERREDVIHVYTWMEKVAPLLHKFLVSRAGFAVGDFNDKDIWGRFFTVFNTEVSYEVILKDGCFEEKKVTQLATNRAGEIISFRVQYGKGNVIFLPPIKTENWDAFEGVLIDAIRGQFKDVTLAAAPRWLDKYKMPGEGKNKHKIDALESQLKDLVSQKLQLEKEEEDLNNLKGLLYEQGKHGLEPLVRRAFRVLEFNVLDPEDYDEPYDLYITEDEGISIIGEVEGSVSQIGIEKYRQLFDYVDARLSKGEKCKGILVGNGFLEQDPELRGEQFSPKAIDGCVRQDFCALSTFELYKMVSDVIKSQNDKRLKEMLRDELINESGEYRYMKQPFEAH